MAASPDREIMKRKIKRARGTGTAVNVRSKCLTMSVAAKKPCTRHDT